MNRGTEQKMKQTDGYAEKNSKADAKNKLDAPNIKLIYEMSDTR